MPTFALAVWPIAAIALFAALGPQRGLIWSVVIGYLFLPDSYVLNPPGLPGYSKPTAIAMGALLGALFFGSKLPQEQSETDRTAIRLFTGLFVLLALGPVITTTMNRVPVFFGPTMARGMTLWDVQSHLVPLCATLVPWFLARRYLHAPDMHAEILRAMVLVGLFYTLLTLFELRMSPQLNNFIYGYFPHYWQQHLRGGGYRPLVFLDHGLSLGFFLLTAVLAGVALIRVTKKEKRAFYILAAIWIFLVLAVSRNLGALAIGVMFLPIGLILTRHLQVRIAALIVLIFMLNPLIREAYVQPLLAAAQVVEQHRHDSLKTRFDNEQALLERFNQKPITGWGEWSRWRIHDEFGNDITISDGTWIIVLGKWGWIGYIGFFGLFSVPIFLMARAMRRREASHSTTALTLITAANLIYLIPNSTLSPIGWLIAGAMAGFVQVVPARAATGAADPAPTGRGQPVYTRFKNGPPEGRTSPEISRPAQIGAGLRSPRPSGK